MTELRMHPITEAEYKTWRVHSAKFYAAEKQKEGLSEVAQADVKSKGFDRLGLHVFGYNKPARQLYRSLGFETTNIVMYKNLI